MKIRVTVFPFSSVRAVYPTQVYAGLNALKESGFIELNYGRHNPRSQEVANGLINENGEFGHHFGRCVYLEVSQDGRTKSIFFDLADGPPLVSLTASNLCDLYFKRAYVPQDEIHSSPNIYPFGLYYSVSNQSLPSNFKQTYYASINRKWSIQKIAREFLQCIKKSQHPRIDDFSAKIEIKEDEPNILFQTRLFESPSNDHPHYQINMNRIEFCRKLRENFGRNFVGGLVDSKTARKMAPANLITKKGNVNDWINEIRRCSICISTAGLGGTNPDKLAIYLSMGRCVISQKLNHTLPNPLKSGNEVFFFSEENECIEIIKSLLKTPGKILETQRNGLNHFNQHIHPRETLKRCLLTATR